MSEAIARITRVLPRGATITVVRESDSAGVFEFAYRHRGRVACGWVCLKCFDRYSITDLVGGADFGFNGGLGNATVLAAMTEHAELATHHSEGGWLP